MFSIVAELSPSP
jgi:hypothetical protein